MRIQNPNRIKMGEIVARFVPQLLAIYSTARRRYLYELDQRVKTGRTLTREEARVRHVLAAIALIEAEDTPRPPRRRSPWK